MAAVRGWSGGSKSSTIGLSSGGEPYGGGGIIQWSLEKDTQRRLGFFSLVALIPCEKIIMREKPKKLASLSVLFIIGITGLKHLRT